MYHHIVQVERGPTIQEQTEVILDIVKIYLLTNNNILNFYFRNSCVKCVNIFLDNTNVDGMFPKAKYAGRVVIAQALGTHQTSA